MKKRNFVLRGFNAFTLAERISGSAGAKLQAGKGGLAAARSAEYGLNPSPPAPLPQGERGNEEMFLPQGERGNKAFTLAERICRGRLNPSPLCGRGEKADGCKAGKREPQSRQRQRSDNRRERKAFSRGAGVRGNNGFTLAEVLITLVIIGVIGALTVPALMQNTRNKENIAAAKKAYSTLSNTVSSIIAEEGTPKCSEGGWACSAKGVYEQIVKYSSTAKTCGEEKGCWSNSWGENGTGSGWYHLVFADGMMLTIWGGYKDCNAKNGGSADICAEFMVDVNGSKKPNQAPKDWFGFVLKENGVFPYGCEGESAGTSNYCAEGKANGYPCTCKILMEN